MTAPLTPRLRSAPIRIRTEADVLALVPFTFGFVPEDSLVLLTLDASASPFHARIDLPDDPSLLPAAVDRLLAPTRVNGGSRALTVVYTADPCVALEATSLLQHALDGLGIETILALRADGERWYPIGPGDRDDDVSGVAGVPYDLRTHPLTTRSVFEGRVTHASRQALADSVATTDLDAAEAVEEAVRRLRPLQSLSGEALATEGRLLVGRVRALLRQDDPPDPETVARILRGVAHPEVRQPLWGEITRFTSDRHVVLWRALVRRTPEELVAPAAGMLAFAAWLAGEGALAWCAVDRCLQADPDHDLGTLVADALERGLPPSSWQPVDPSTPTWGNG